VELTGRAVYPESPSYAEARADWDRLFSSYPRVIVFAENADDVVNAVIWARENEVELRVRSGRHCLEGWSNVSDGIVVDVSQMKSARLDPRAATVTVGAGLTQVEAVAALGEKPFRAKQLSNHYFSRLTVDPAEMTDIPAASRERLVADLMPTLFWTDAMFVISQKILGGSMKGAQSGELADTITKKWKKQNPDEVKHYTTWGKDLKTA